MDQSNKVPDIVFIYPEDFPQEIITDELSSIQQDNLDVRVVKKGNGAYNGFEWIIPTAFGAYILKPYFDSFLSEAGKDHYDILKKSLKKLIEKGKQFETKAIASDQSPDKLSKSYTQSLTVSIEFQTLDNRHIKLIFDNNLSIEDWNDGIEKFIQLISENYETYPNDKLSQKIAELNTKAGRIIYVLINSESKELEFFDDRKLIEKYHVNVS
jgi:hypothetical protein